MKEVKTVNGEQIMDDEEGKAALLLALVSDDLEQEIAKHFSAGRYTKDDVKKFVRASKLTSAKFKKVTGEDYTP